MALDLTSLTANVAKDTDAENSAITLLGNLKALLDKAIADLKTAGNTPEELAALQALSDQLGNNADKLAAAIVENTPQG